MTARRGIDAPPPDIAGAQQELSKRGCIDQLSFGSTRRSSPLGGAVDM
jgi:hypothetical protein